MVDAADARIRSQKPVRQLGHREVIHEGEYSAEPGERQAAAEKRKSRSVGTPAVRGFNSDYLDDSFLSVFSPFLAWRPSPAFSSFSWSSLLILARSCLSSLPFLLVSYFSSISFRSVRRASAALGSFLPLLSASAARTRTGLKPPRRARLSANVYNFFIDFFFVCEGAPGHTPGGFRHGLCAGLDGRTLRKVTMALV